MKAARLVPGLALVVGLAAAVVADSRDDTEPGRTGSGLFREGKFAEAEAVYTRAWAENPKNPEAAFGLGTVALFRNELDLAAGWLKEALRLKPDSRAAKKQLALVCYRRHDFALAAALYRDLDLEALAKKLEACAKETPYRIEGKADVTNLSFIQTDPLPVIRVKVKGETVNFLIDTGASEVYLDPDLARRVGAAQYGSMAATFGGGKQADAGQGSIEDITLGEFVVHNVPVQVLGTRRFDAIAGGKRVEGILGTVMLSQFLATIDYPNGRLILRRKTAEQLRQVEEQVRSAKGIAVPFWLAGEHFMVAWGQVNKSKPMLFFADTGLAGGGFVCPRSTLNEAAIKLPEGPGFEGVGGGGKIKAVPFNVEELSLGAAKARNVQAFAGVFPEQLEYGEGFRIGGFVSHQFFRPYALTLDFTGMRFFLVEGKPKAGGP
jgi:tetratricopeptide (TPR) repeat protein